MLAQQYFFLSFTSTCPVLKLKTEKENIKSFYDKKKIENSQNQWKLKDLQCHKFFT